MSLKEIEDASHFKLNNEIDRPADGQILLSKDREAFAAFFKESVEPNTRKFSSVEEKINFLMKEDFTEAEFIEKYPMDSIEELCAFLDEQYFQLRSFMAVYKSYSQYALKDNAGTEYLETYEDRVALNAPYFADDDEELVLTLADEVIHQRY